MTKPFSPRSLRRCALGAALLILASLSLWAAALPTARPADVGLSAERLNRLSRLLQARVDEGTAAGMVALIIRDGRVAYLKPFGKLDLERPAPMPVNGIFRIASQSKAVTSVAVMILQEEGKLLIDDPVSKYIPEFGATTVAVQAEAKDAKGCTVVPAKRAITIRDLLTHTAGISYGYGPGRDAWAAAGIQGWFLADRSVPIGDIVKKIATLPFDAQPGEKWVYGYNTDILGYLVERVSGMSLADFVARRITGPLGMADTSFFLPAGKLDRFTSVYGVDDKGVFKRMEDARDNFYMKGPRMCYAGGAGLLSTAEDYGRFLLCLLNGGRLDGARILSPKSVELMTVNHVGKLEGGPFGLGFWVTERLGLKGELGSVGSFGWGGAYYTTYWVDPAERMVALLMIQLLPPPANYDLQAKFKAMVYQAVVDSYERR
jgi:CubicO group peptidase (beta-lactamase class C family)